MMLTGEGSNQDEIGVYRLEQPPTDFYRCPVSTPANNKRPLEDYDPITDTITPPLQDKSLIDFRSSFSRNRTRTMQKPTRKNVEYYFVDKTVQRREMNETNSFWLQSLCAQPVAEILGKYRRKSDFQRTRFLWSKMFSTPGEKALLQAWTCNSSSNQRPSATTETTSHPQQLSLSSEMKVCSVRSAGHGRANMAATPDTFRPYVMSASGYHQQNPDFRPGSKSLSRQSPMIRLTDDKAREDSQNREDGPEAEALPILNGQRKKAQLVLQQRKYFSGNRKHPSIPHVQRLNPVRSEDIAQNADVICLRPNLMSPSSRDLSHDISRGHFSASRDRRGSAYSTTDVEKVPYRFPLIVSTRTEDEVGGDVRKDD